MFHCVESDEELFEDDPIEFIRRDLEGSDTETRRRASADLVRGLLTLFEKQVTDIFSRHITACLAVSFCHFHLMQIYFSNTMKIELKIGKLKIPLSF